MKTKNIIKRRSFNCLVCGVTALRDTTRFFKLPANKTKRAIWLHAVERWDLIDKWVPENKKICEKHFTNDMFAKSGNKLKVAAIPIKNIAIEDNNILQNGASTSTADPHFESTSQNSPIKKIRTQYNGNKPIVDNNAEELIEIKPEIVDCDYEIIDYDENMNDAESSSSLIVHQPVEQPVLVPIQFPPTQNEKVNFISPQINIPNVNMISSSNNIKLNSNTKIQNNEISKDPNNNIRNQVENNMEIRDNVPVRDLLQRNNNVIYTQYLASKLCKYNATTRAIVENAINNILFEADMGWYENPNSRNKRVEERL